MQITAEASSYILWSSLPQPTQWEGHIFLLTFLVIGHQGFGDGLADCCEKHTKRYISFVKVIGHDLQSHLSPMFPNPRTHHKSGPRDHHPSRGLGCPHQQIAPYPEEEQVPVATGTGNTTGFQITTWAAEPPHRVVLSLSSFCHHWPLPLVEEDWAVTARPSLGSPIPLLWSSV